MLEPRYAIYFAPAPDTELWRFGSEVIGYDAATGKDIEGFAPPGFSEDRWRDATAKPRTYGFHATLKAPFRLNGQAEEELLAALMKFCRRRNPVSVGLVGVTAVVFMGLETGFAALTPRHSPPALHDLERDVVVAFDGFRIAMTPDERKKRRPAALSERQRSYLDTYGYPFVLDEYRFHMSLTEAVDDAPTVADVLADITAERLGGVMLTVDGLALFRQDAPGARFRIISRVPFGGSP